MPGYSNNSRDEKSYTYKLTAAVLGVLCALFLVLIGVFLFSQIRVPKSLELTVDDEEFLDNAETYYEDMAPVPYSSYVAAGNQS